ncbi:MAG: hypothetical protein U0271_06800 [Polyangiaceae bacterium]
MGDVTADIKTRYSIYVPKPLARINLGGWQKKEGASNSPRFGYDGVSIQSDKSLFIDVTKSTYLQARGGFVGHSGADWLQVSFKAMTLATTDNALMGADGTVTVAAGAGQGPTMTLDHGDALETVPYLSLSLHYRVEEVQNSLFEFFRGRRKKKDPAMGKDLSAGYARNWELFLKDEVVFDSSSSEHGMTEAQVVPDGKQFKYDATPNKLQGGFELLAEQSWQRLWGKDDWDYSKFDQRSAPHEIFKNLKDLRRDPTAAAHDDAAGAEVEGALKYGYSAYFSRFDPYLWIDPDSFASDAKLNALEKGVCKLLAKLNNLAMIMKRCTDVLYRAAAALKQVIPFSNMLQNTILAVDAFNSGVKSIRGNAEMFAALGRWDRGNVFEQVADEGAFGFGARAQNLYKTDQARKFRNSSGFRSTAQATVRSCAPYKDPNDPDPTTASKGFYGVRGRIGNVVVTSGTQLKAGDQLHIRCQDESGNVHEFDTPPLVISPTAAKIQGWAPLDPNWTFEAPAKITVKFDGESTGTVVDLTAMSAAKPKITGATIAASGVYGGVGSLVGKELKIKVDGGTEVSFTFDTTAAADQAAMVAAINANFPLVTASVSGGKLELISRSAKYGPGASIEVVDCTAKTALGLTPSKVSGPTTAAIQDYFKTQVGGRATLSSGVLKLQSSTTGTASEVNLSADSEALLDGIGLTGADVFGTAGDVTKITADDLVALFNTSEGAANKWVTFSAEDGQVVITNARKGDGSEITVSNGPNGSTMANALAFLGDFHGDSDHDKIEDLPEIAQGLDDFDKVNTELMRMPDDVGNLIRPLIIAGKNAMGMVSKTTGVVKALAKIGGIKLPTAKGSIGLVANKGISLGTPDRIVGVGGQGVVFVADGGSGAADHAKYMPLEDLFNRIIGADFFAKIEQYKAKESLGFKVFSDTTADLIARNTAHLLALGRIDDGNNGTTGAGVARVAGSYAVELAAQEKVVVGARQKDSGRVEVLGSTIALGATKLNLAGFGLETRGKAAAWPVNLTGADETKQHPLTQNVQVHAAEQVSVVVGNFMLQMRSAAAQKATIAAANARKRELARQKRHLQRQIRRLPAMPGPVMPGGAPPEHPDRQRLQDEIALATQNETAAQQEIDDANANLGDGIVIAMRDATKAATTHWPMEGKPSILVTDKGVTITTTTGKDAQKFDAAGPPPTSQTARITLDANGITIVVGENKAGLVINNNKFMVSDGTADNTLVLQNKKFEFTGAAMNVSASQKITLG